MAARRAPAGTRGRPGGHSPTRHRCWRAIASAGLLLAAGAACAPAPPPADDRDAGAPAAAAPAGLHSIELQGDAASRYETESDGRSHLGAVIARRFPDLAVAACLERAAQAHADLPAGLDLQVPLAFTEFALHWAGCPDPTTSLSVLLTSEPGPGPMLEQLAMVLHGASFTHVGAATSPATPPYAARWFVLLVDRRMSMSPVESAGEPGAQLPLQFRLDERYTGATIAVTRPRGEIEESAVGLSNGTAVAGVRLADEVGTQWIELIGHGPSGPEVLALFPVEVGRQPPRRWVGRPVADESWVDTTEEAESLAARLVDEDRSRFGLARLEWDPQLAAIARAHSSEMADEGYFAHLSPRTGSVVDRLEQSGYPATFAAENIAMAPTLGEAHDRLMQSPGHRAAVLTPNATHFGIGVVSRHDPRLGTVHHLTQLFVRRSPAPDGR
ncbi:MAG TPA: CAP domain-containing protein [Thermoanaerobaculales bacterium]|nr:CAP domain-containing protein [Thermoanaerobaculales bacterium]HPA79333.1 CAP domain-containing protein [Thermoanaerobaculales bacterium]HQL30203.1 CAP domain-containing protein [Thermoanaerobaculales bacterium]HQN96172.1 CAP domain-containing protein [Thermoanaerobaculales bacterium]HQP43103.1 CAP domain-containing protein [Thermoanaerobaculales bacterium]